MTWLAGFLGSSERPVQKVRKEAENVEISAKSLYAAKKALKVEESGSRGSLKWAMPSTLSAAEEEPIEL